MNPKTEHSRFGGSNAHRWLHCPYSAGKDREYIEDKGGAAAKRGTALHKAAETIKAGGKCRLGEESLALIHDYIAFLDDLYHGPEPKMEFRAHATSVHAEAFGTFDYVDYHNGILTIVDLKTGSEPVPAYMNEQLAFGAVAVTDELKIEPAEYRLYIWQNGEARLWMPEPSGIALFRECFYTMALLSDFADPVTGPYCSRCKVKDCPARAKLVENEKDLVNW